MSTRCFDPNPWPRLPTNARPGSDEKIRLLRLSLFVAGDNGKPLPSAQVWRARHKQQRLSAVYHFRNRWCVVIKRDGRQQHLGVYWSRGEAFAALWKEEPE